MKLLIILSIEESTDAVRKIMAKQKVAIYSETEIHGFRTEEYQPDISNWFASNGHGVYSKLFFSFQDEGTVKKVVADIEEFNASHTDRQQNPLHAYLLDAVKAV